MLESLLKVYHNCETRDGYISMYLDSLAPSFENPKDPDKPYIFSPVHKQIMIELIKNQFYYGAIDSTEKRDAFISLLVGKGISKSEGSCAANLSVLGNHGWIDHKSRNVYVVSEALVAVCMQEREALFVVRFNGEDG